MTTTQTAAKPPFIQARELYGELFEAENLATAMWHFSQMKLAEQRFIQAHLLFLLLHGQAVANLNLKDIREQLDYFDERLEDTQGEEDSVDRADLEAEDGGAVERGDVPEAGDDADEQEEEEEDEDEQVDAPARSEHRAEKNAGNDAPLAPQLEAAVGVLREALTFGNAPEAP